VTDLDYHLVLVCTDRGTHPEHELAVLVPIRPRTDLLQMGVDLPESEERAAALKRGFGPMEGLTRVSGARRRVIRKSPVELRDGRDGKVVAHVPTCPTCRRAPRVNVDVLLRAGNALATIARDPGRVVLDVSLLPPIRS